ncbi:ATP-binding protein [Rickettsiaceae bacterium]|nr:ATP-binding protein [Rickettsiaceae bacterium]
MVFNIDVAIVVSFLLLTLYLGVKHSKGVKTIEDYALGGRNFGTVALTSTITATAVTGSLFFFTLEKTFTDGWLWIFVTIAASIELLMLGVFVAPRMQPFLSDMTIAESLGRLYGKNLRIIASILAIISVMGTIALQFRVFARIFESLVGWNNEIMVVISGCIVIFYSCLGGVRGVTFTDILQAIMFCFAIPFVTITIWDFAYFENLNVYDNLQRGNFSLSKVLDVDNYNLWIALPTILFFAIPALNTTSYQRMLIGKSISSTKKSFIISSVIYFFIAMSISWLAFLLNASDSHLDPQNLFIYIIDNYSTVGFQGILVAGVIAMIMSTADSNLNVSSVLFAHDFCKPLNISKKSELFIARTFVFVIGFGSIILALSMDDLLKIILTTRSYYVPVVTVPMLLTIFGFRTTRKSIMIGMGAGFVSTVAWKFITVPIDGIVICMLINLVFLLGSHYFLNQEGGWTQIKCEFVESAKKKRKKKFKKYVEYIKGFNLLEFCKVNAPSNQFTYMRFGLYCIIYGISVAFSTHPLLRAFDHKIVLHSYQCMVITGTMIASYPIWPLSISKGAKERIIQIWWHFAVFYMLFFFGIYFVLLSKLATVPICYFVMNMLFASVLVGWRVAFLMLAVGLYLAIEFYKYTTGFDSINLHFGSPSSVFVYVLGIVTSGTIIFMKHDQDKQELLKQKNYHLTDKVELQKSEISKSTELKNEFLRNVPHESNNALTPILGFINILNERYDHLSDEERKEMLGYAADSSNKLEGLVNNIFDLSNLSSDTYKINKKAINLSDLVYVSLEKCRRLYIDAADSENRIWDIDIQDNIILNCDEYYIGQTLDNLIINAIQYCKEGRIGIYLKKESKGNYQFIKFTIYDEGIGIPKNEIDEIFNPFITSSKTRKIQQGRGIGLTLSKKVIELHDGKITVEANQKKGSVFSFLLPV